MTAKSFVLVAHNDGSNYMVALEWTGDLIQDEVDSYGLYIDGWDGDYSQPREPGLWLASAAIEDEFGERIEWRRLTPDELAAFAEGVWPLQGGAQ